MKEVIESLFMCLGVGLMYLGASAADQGNTFYAVGCFAFGVSFLGLMLALTFNRS